MSEINSIFDKSTKQLLRLANSLKNNNDLQNKMLKHLLDKPNVETSVQEKANRKFKRHPSLLSSETDDSETQIPLKNGYIKEVFCYHSYKNCDSCETVSKGSELGDHLAQHSNVGLSSNHSFYSKRQSSVNLEMENEIIGNVRFQQGNQSSSNAINLKTYTKGDPPEKLISKNVKQSISKPPVVEQTLNGYVNTDKKLQNMLPKILNSLKDIRTLMTEKIPMPDGEEDWERRRNRATEFSTRFSRNYLYELGRQINELEKLTKPSVKTTSAISTNVHHCLTSTHQTVLQALQAYRSHIPTSLPNAVIDKLKTLLEYTLTLCKLHNKCVNLEQTCISGHENFIDALKKATEELLAKVQDIIEKSSPGNPKFSTFNMDVKVPKKRKSSKKSTLEGRLSMYSISQVLRNNTAWRKTMQAVARDKYTHVRSRYKTSGYKYRHPVEKTPVVDLHPKFKLFPKRSSGIIKSTPINTIRKDDDIPTMIGMQNEKEANNNNIHANDMSHTSENVQQPDIQDAQLFFRAFLTEYCQQCLRNKSGDMTQEQRENFARVLSGMDQHGKINNNNNQESGSKKNGYTNHQNYSADFKQALMKCVDDMNLRSLESLLAVSKTNETHEHNGITTNHRADTDINLSLVEQWGKNFESDVTVSKRHEHPTNDKDIDEACYNEIYQNNKKKAYEKVIADQTRKGKRRMQNTIVTGEKNAQLIWIRDEGSIIDSPNDTITTAKDIKNDSCYSEGISNENQINITRKKDNTGNVDEGSSQTSIVLNRSTKNVLKQLAPLPEKQLANILQYRIHYCKFIKKDHLYQKTARIKPWVLVDKLSDALLDDLLMSLAGEIGINSIVDNMVRAEFQ